MDCEKIDEKTFAGIKLAIELDAFYCAAESKNYLKRMPYIEDVTRSRVFITNEYYKIILLFGTEEEYRYQKLKDDIKSKNKEYTKRINEGSKSPKAKRYKLETARILRLFKAYEDVC